MGLRALVFSSDGDSTSAICHVLTDLGIEAEICSEMLVAVERITNSHYDALLVDWDHQTDAVFLLKTQREQKRTAQALTLALVHNDAGLPEALQAGANSVIRKPVDPQQAADTLSTAKQLILARQTDRREHEARLAAAQAIPLEEPPVPQPPPIPVPPEEEPIKTGFLQQTAPKSALEAEQAITTPTSAEAEPAAKPEPPAPAPLPSEVVRARALSILGYGDKNEKPASPEVSEAPAAQSAEEPRSQDKTRVFSSLPEPDQNEVDSEPTPRPRYGVYAAVAALLIVGVLWAFAPGDSYSARFKHLNLQRFIAAKKTASTTRPVPPPAPPAPAPAAAPKPAEPIEPDPEITSAQDEDANSVQVIENKPIPVAGAQQPPSPDPAPDIATPPTPDSSSTATDASAPQPAVATAQPQLHAVADVQGSTTPAVVPAVPQPQATQPTPATAPSAPASAPPASPENRNTVIIPDSLRSSPQSAPASTFEPLTVPEDTSRAMLIKKVDPDYPPQAIPQRLEGSVVLLAWVGPDGSIRDLKLIRGSFLLGRAAFEAVKQWRFKPYSQNGRAIDFQTYITVNFKLPS